jgi:hypothetical protein
MMGIGRQMLLTTTEGHVYILDSFHGSPVNFSASPQCFPI